MDSHKNLYKVLCPIYSKNVGAEKGFFKIFTTANFVYLKFPIITQRLNKQKKNKKKILRVASEKNGYKVILLIWGKNILF